MVWRSMGRRKRGTSSSILRWRSFGLQLDEASLPDFKEPQVGWRLVDYRESDRAGGNQ
jgi:hypothetical protein